MRGLGNAVVLMPGAGYNLQSLPGYVGNNPPMVVASAKNVFEQPQYPVQQAQQVQQVQQAQTQTWVPPPPARNNPGMHISLPRQVIVQPPPPVQPPVQPPPVQPPPVQPPPAAPSTPSNYEIAQQAYAAAQAQQQQSPAKTEQVEAPKSSTATAVSIGAAGILAALLFK